MPFVAGETIGSYKIIEPFGQGGMASVFKAYHAALDRYVAIKVLHLALNGDPNFIARFRREARVVARLDHPNIVPVYDFAEYEGQPYLVMKFIEGETLKARLLRGAVKHEDILPIVEAVGAALTYAHHMNVLHRDVKPSNVLLTNNGQIYLADFGLAKMIDRDDASLTAERLEGTPLYISPEQAMAKPDLDARTDEYSFGVMTYEMIAGRVPFNADTPLGTVHDHIYKPPPDPRTLAPEVSEDMQAVLLKVLAKNRDDRFKNVASFVRAFRAAFTGQPVIPEGSVIVQSSEDEQLVFVPPDAVEDEPLGRPAVQAPAAPEGTSKSAPPIDLESLPPVVANAASAANTANRADSSGQGNPAGGAPPVSGTGAVTAPLTWPPSRPASQPIPQAVKKPGRPSTLLVVIAVILGAVVLFVSGIILRGVLFKGQQPAATSIPTAAPTVDLPSEAIRQDLDAAVAAWKNGDLAAAQRQIEKAHLDIAGDTTNFNKALNYLEGQKSWLLAAAFVYSTDRPKLLESITAQVELVHEILYRAAADPLSADFMQRNSAKPLFEVAYLRYEIYFGDIQSAAGDLNKVLNNRVQSQRFPEARLLQAELALKQGNSTQASSLLSSLVTDNTLPGWVHDLASSLDQSIKPK